MIQYGIGTILTTKGDDMGTYIVILVAIVIYGLVGCAFCKKL